MNSKNFFAIMNVLSMLIASISVVLSGTVKVIIPLLLAAAGIALFVGLCYFLIAAILILLIMCEILCLFNLFCEVAMFLMDIVNGTEHSKE